MIFQISIYKIYHQLFLKNANKSYKNEDKITINLIGKNYDLRLILKMSLFF